MTTSSSNNNEEDSAQQAQAAMQAAGLSNRAGEFLNLEALANLAVELSNATAAAWKSSRQGYASDIDELVLQNLPESIRSSDYSIPTKEQLQGLPETIARGETPKTPVANRDASIEKTKNILQTTQIETLPFAFLNEIRPLMPQPDADWSISTANAAEVWPQVAEHIFDYSQIDSVVRSLESYSSISTIPTMSTNTDTLNSNAQPLNSYRQTMAAYAGVVPVLEPFARNRKSSQFEYGYISAQPFDVERVRRDFPILQEKVNGHDLIWLDNAATTQKPQSVIDRVSNYFLHENSNIHRAAHELAARSTDAYEGSRETVRRFINASSASEVIFVRGATEAINLVAQSWGRQYLQKDDEILISWLEHHANIVPWQMLCAERGARLRVAPVDDSGQIILDEYERLLNPRTKLVAIAQVSNALGTITPLEHMVAAAHRHGARVLVDGAQAISHMSVDVQLYDCDFYVFSGHKIYAPTGIGVLYAKAEILETMRPWQGGGNMIKDVTFAKTIYQSAPLRFEAGTGSIADAVGLAAAIDYVERLGMANINQHETDLLNYASAALAAVPGLRLIGTAADKAAVLSFVLDGYRTEEVSAALNLQGIAVRAGHHCAQPILRRFGVESTVRPSLGLYNTCAEIDHLIDALWNLKKGREMRSPL